MKKYKQKQNELFNPVVLVTFGIVLLAVAIIMVATRLHPLA
jgi:hypothetical protein